ncbi:MAG: efflux transporter outer membrane subunit [Desulfovibrio sp.]|uniref:efflux transporter outer membrane subunit n=1 Tax=Desulfovibrio sp. 7SRBS1 TaxID=3378064 RepID=UPI003B3F1304
MRKLQIIIAVTAALLLAGCGPALHTDYKRPDLTIPASWNATGNTSGAVNSLVGDAAQWPTSFGDSKLESLVELALARNNDLAAATIRVRKAQLEAGIAQRDLIPGLSATGTSNNSKEVTHDTDWTNSYSANLQVSYEVDLWGKLSSAYDAKKWEAIATDQDRQSTALSLVGTTMQLYWQIAYYNVRLSLSAANIKSAEETLQLVKSQEKYGVATDLEVNEALKTLAGLKVSRQPLVQSRQEAINSLAVLFDMPPGEVMADPHVLQVATMPTIPAGLPAQLLGRRPDLRAAELRLRELLAQTDVARANFYPTLALTGSLGGSSTELADVLENPIGTLATNLALPFLNWNTLTLREDVSKADYDEAVINFRQSLYVAMKDVENALSNRTVLQRQSHMLQENLTAARKVEHIYEVRYKAGYGTLKDWLQAQNSRRAAEASLTENLYNRLVNFVTLYQALGGQPAQVERTSKEG